MWRGPTALPPPPTFPQLDERQALFHQTLGREGGWQAAARPNPNDGRSSPVSHSDHMRGADSVRLGPAFGQRHNCLHARARHCASSLSLFYDHL